MGNPAPRVSLGLPVYNGQTHVGEAIDSLLRQTFEDFELIISDNGSTDRTESICRARAAGDPRIRYYRQAENRGAVWNFNRVLELSRGAYFKWAAHDDVCGSTFLDRCVDVLDADPSIAWCHSRFAHVDRQGARLRGPDAHAVSYSAPGDPRSDKPTRQSPQPHERFAAVLLGTGGCLDFYGLMRTGLARKASPLLPYYGSDKVFVAQLSLLGRFLEIPETSFFVRVHPEGSGCLGSAAQQQSFIDPRRRCRLALTRLQLLVGHARAVWRAELTAAQRTRCLAVLVQYLFQVRKWKDVARRALTGAGTGGGYKHVVEPDTAPFRAETVTSKLAEEKIECKC